MGVARKFLHSDFILFFELYKCHEIVQYNDRTAILPEFRILCLENLDQTTNEYYSAIYF